ncbi:MAG TPA: fasciclin domain-containing protein [Pseudonocardia sp.]|nr:fasciclin domain-containing protein [Pseudonocardia sp.]
MRHSRRPAAAGAMAALALALGACASSVTAPAPGAGAADPVAPAAAVAELSDLYGADCAGVLTTGTAGRPITDVLADSPALSTVAAAVGSVPALVTTLRTEDSVTVFAPGDAAFAALRASMGGAEYAALLADRDRLDGLLSHHITGKRYDAGQLVAAGKSSQLAYGDVTVGGEPATLTLTGTGGTTARVLCGNVPTATGMLFVIDTVLVPAV